MDWTSGSLISSYEDMVTDIHIRYNYCAAAVVTSISSAFRFFEVGANGIAIPCKFKACPWWFRTLNYTYRKMDILWWQERWISRPPCNTHCPSWSKTSHRRWVDKGANWERCFWHIPIESHGRNRVGVGGTKNSIKNFNIYSLFKVSWYIDFVTKHHGQFNLPILDTLTCCIVRRQNVQTV